MYRNGQSKFQLGSNTAAYDFLDAGNAAQAHVLAARALLRDTSAHTKSAAGEVFHITDGVRRHFNDATRCIFRAAGDKTDFEKEVRVIPRWLALGMAHMLEWGFWIGSLGYAKPPMEVGVEAISHATQEWTYDIEKAKRVLKYQPIDRFEETLQCAVKAALDRDPI